MCNLLFYDQGLLQSNNNGKCLMISTSIQSKALVNFQAEHQDLLKRFLSFFNLKKEQCNKQVHLAISDTKDECLKQQAIFTKGDLEKAFERLQEEIEGTVRQELETFYRMSGVFIQMMMFEAEQQNSTLRADVNYMENYKALEEIKDFEQLSLTGHAQDFTLQKKKTTAASKLPTLGSAMMMTSAESGETQQLKQQNATLQKMMAALQEKLTQALAGRSQLSEEVEGKVAESGAQIGDLERRLERMQDERDKAMEVAENLRKETQNTKLELQKKVNQLTQVTNMKKMIQEKNSKIQELRERLGKYEADIGGGAGDDDDL